VVFNLGRIIGGVRALFRREAVDRDLDDELRAFVASAIEDKTSSGLSQRLSPHYSPRSVFTE